MPKLSEGQDNFLSELIEMLKDDSAMAQLSDWERGFMSDQIVRYEQYGSDMFMSDKQMDIVYRVGDKFGLSRPDEKGVDEQMNNGDERTW